MAQPRGSLALGLLCLQTGLPGDPVCPHSSRPRRGSSLETGLLGPGPHPGGTQQSAGLPPLIQRCPPPPQQHLGSLLEGTIGARQEWASRRGSRGGARQEGEQVPRRPCLGRSPALAGLCTLCALGGHPTSAGPERQAVSAENWPRPRCSQRPASGSGRQTRAIPSRCFRLASLPSWLAVSHLSPCPHLLTLHGGPRVRPASRPRHAEGISQDPPFLALQTKKYADVIIPRGVDNMGKEQACAAPTPQGHAAGTAQPVQVTETPPEGEAHPHTCVAQVYNTLRTRNTFYTLK